MRINYFVRNKESGFSIGRVFHPIYNQIIKNNELHCLEVPYNKADPISFIKNLLFVFRHRDKHGVNHITGDIHYCIIALVGCKSVLTIHDIGFVENKLNPTNKFSILLKRLFWLLLPVAFANRVTCVSEKTCLDVKRLVPERYHKKISVIYNPVNEDYSFYPKSFNPVLPIILHIGTGSNKNLERVAKAIVSINCILTIIGKLRNQQLRLLDNLGIKFNNESNLTDSEIIKRYKESDIVSFPSLYEGFGMPIIEAQAIGRPVLTSNIPPMNEVADKNSVYFVNPNSIEEIRKGFLSIIESEKLRNTLIDNGIRNVTKYSAQKISEEYLSLYRSI